MLDYDDIYGGGFVPCPFIGTEFRDIQFSSIYKEEKAEEEISVPEENISAETTEENPESEEDISETVEMEGNTETEDDIILEPTAVALYEPVRKKGLLRNIKERIMR